MTILSLKQKLKHSKLIVAIFNLLHRPKPEVKLSYGNENQDKTFYVIGRNDRVGGAWSILIQILNHIAYAVEKGYKPVIDMQNYYNQYILDAELGNVNIWERYFEQPSGYSLDDISRSKNVVVSSTAYAPDKNLNIGLGGSFWTDKEIMKKFQELFKEYIRYSSYMKNYLENEMGRVLQGHRNVIGVLCRGTDYLKNRPAWHDVQPTPPLVLADVKKEFSGGKYFGVFLATEDLDILNEFKAEFGDKLFYLEQDRVSMSDMKGDAWLNDVKKQLNPNEDKNQSFLTYYAATYILSKCSCFFTGRNGGSIGVFLQSPHFDFVKIYDFGKY